ncbi:MAG TPA: carbohydrate-binding domain-containing protein [Oligoflexus sp.]|uniref:carbohydrate-binding domain-containing protein n=1 Tax=Oligoflexus sp. TaxID=1971216 RepID=UPI002D669DF6|nr:carbohydrate-binding domain-containing protein [Oligoflexus sp.]HYX34735.1 carbohydrate-binding domain-containing protein [Oligoflexus sp.]
MVGAPDAGAYEYGSNIVVYAAGQAVDGVYPTMRLLVDNVPVATWTDVKGDAASRKFVAFSYNHPKTAAIGSIQVEFVNDGGRDGGRNLQVDMIKLDGKSYQTEADSTYSTSCTPGYQRSEWLYCNGAVAFEK